MAKLTSRLFPCAKCNKEFRSKGLLTRHVSGVHEEKRDNVCKECGYGFSPTGTLKRHVEIVHHKLRNISCEKCTFKTSTQQSLQRHVKAFHTSKKDYKCTICDYETTQQCILQTDMKTNHLKIKYVKCQLCDSPSAITGHLRRHTILLWKRNMRVTNVTVTVSWSQNKHWNITYKIFTESWIRNIFLSAWSVIRAFLEM